MSEFDAPQSRVEALLQNLLGADNPYGAPQSRIEAILQNMLGANNVLLPPESRNEELLLEILQQGGGGKPTQTKTATPTEQEQTILPDDGYVLREVTVNPIPSQYIVPAGKKTITANATDIDIAQYATADVAVPTADLGTKSITANGTYAASSDNLDGYYEVTVNVNTDTTKGFVIEDYDSDGYPTKARLVGNWTETPTNFTTTNTIYAVIWTHIKELVLPNTLTSIGWASFANYLALEKINIPSSVTLGGYAFNNIPQVTEVNIGGDLTFNNINAFGASTRLSKFVVGGNVTNWLNPYFINSAEYVANTPVMLYDFSHCIEPFTLPAWYQLGHASGCVIRVPQALLANWQEETNWIDLTDVVWEGV